MAKKFKYKENKFYWRLNLTPDELDLIHALLTHVRLGTDNRLQEAAYSLLAAFGEELTEDWSDNHVSVKGSISKEGHLTIEVDFAE